MKPKPRAKRTWRWVTLFGRIVYVTVSARKPKIKGDLAKFDGDYATVCQREFRRLFGFLPPSDKPVKVEFTARIIA